MQVTKDILRNEAVTTVELDDVLSPESYVFVALMSVEEGPNKASFLPIPVCGRSMKMPEQPVVVL